MKKKNNAGRIAAVILLALLLVLGIASCLFLFLQEGSEKLKQSKEPSGNAVTEQTRESVRQEETYTKPIEAFELTKAKSVETEKRQEPEKGQGEETERDTETEAETERDAEAEAASEGYLCSYSSERQITEEDVEELMNGTYEDLPQGKSVIQMVINEMYARYGYQFSSEEIQQYFEQKEWYQDIDERNTDMDSIYQNMTDIEKANVSFLSEVSEGRE